MKRKETMAAMIRVMRDADGPFTFDQIYAALPEECREKPRTTVYGAFTKLWLTGQIERVKKDLYILQGAGNE